MPGQDRCALAFAAHRQVWGGTDTACRHARLGQQEPHQPAGLVDLSDVSHLAACGMAVVQGKFEAAIADYNRAHELCPWSADPVLNRGVALENLQRYAGAAEWLVMPTLWAPA